MFTSKQRVMILSTVAFAVLLAVPAAAAGAASQVASSSPVDTVAVTGNTNGGFFTNININAQSSPSGQNASGSGSFDVGSLVVSGPVTCLSVTGPDRGNGTASAPTDAVLNMQTTNFGIVTVEVVDKGGNGQDVFSAIPTGRAPTDCSPFNLNGITETLNGRATVFDAPLLPTSKDQCKNGGWASFGFRNQGQCIAFVNHS